MNLENFKFKDKKGVMTLISYKSDEEIVVVPDEFEGVPVTVIAKEVFASKNLKEIVLPKHLELIEASAFYYCEKLEIIKFPENFKELKKNSFEHCTNLREVEFPASMEKVPAHAFISCPSLRKVTANSENTKIAPTAFGEGKSLEEVSFHLLAVLKPPSQTNLMVNYILKFNTLSAEEQTALLTLIKKKAAVRKELFSYGNAEIISFLFEQKYKLELDEVDAFLEDSIAKKNAVVTAIFLDYKNSNFTTDEKDKFDENKELVEIGLELPTLKQFKAKWKCTNVDGGLKVTGYKGNETHETIPTELECGKKIVELGAFHDKTLGSITSLRIEAPIKTIDEFYRCVNLQEIYLPDTIEETKKLRFRDCRNLKIVNIPNNSKILSERMFESCESLEEIVIPDSVEIIEMGAFYNCTNLQKITLKDPKIDTFVFQGCTKLADKQGLIIFQNVVYDYIGSADIVVVPDGVTEISCRAFKDACLKEITLPQSLVKIEYMAFHSAQIKRIEIPDGVTEISGLAFCNCINLKEVILPKNLTSIGEYCFNYCIKIENIALPEKLEFINKNAFNSCEKLETLAFPKSLKSIGEKAFYDCYGLKEITGLDGVEVDETAFEKLS